MDGKGEVVGPGGIWGRVQGVGSDPWGTNSQPSLGLHPCAARTRADARFLVEFEEFLDELSLFFVFTLFFSYHNQSLYRA